MASQQCNVHPAIPVQPVGGDRQTNVSSRPQDISGETKHNLCHLLTGFEWTTKPWQSRHHVPCKRMGRIPGILGVSQRLVRCLGRSLCISVKKRFFGQLGIRPSLLEVRLRLEGTKCHPNAEPDKDKNRYCCSSEKATATYEAGQTSAILVVIRSGVVTVTGYRILIGPASWKKSHSKRPVHS